MRQDPPNLLTPTLARQYYRLFEGYLRFGEDLWGRCWTIASGSLHRAVEQVEAPPAANRPTRMATRLYAMARRTEQTQVNRRSTAS